MSWFAALVSAAGFGRFGAFRVASAIAAMGLIVGAVALQATGVAALALAIFMGTSGVLVEVLGVRARSRRKTLTSSWPQVIDSLTSATTSGVSITESFIELAELAPETLRPYFEAFKDRVLFGATLEQALLKLQEELGDLQADRLVMLVRIVNSAGGHGYTESLRRQAQLARESMALQGEVEAKQGWVSGTAKLALVAPWLIVAMLCVRQENQAAFASPAGFGILGFGLIVSIFAFRLIQIFGRMNPLPRVFE